ncbi:MAG: glycosyltransferase family 39 protein [Pirellulales bacterium]|nr:glycosyltransferase family 39 protein [Pirellulales bacterium]
MTTVIYAPTFVVPFDFLAFDDTFYVKDEPNINAGFRSGSLHWAFTSSVAANWHPVTVLSHMLDSQLYGLAPRGHHLTNVLLHAANVALLFWLLGRMTSRMWPSALVAAFFAWHPQRVESVAWVAERKDVLSTFFMLLALHAYTRYATDRRGAFYIAALAAFALGLMSKPMLVTLPFLLLLIDYWPLGRIAWLPSGASRVAPQTLVRLLVEKLPFLLLSLGAIYMTVWAQGRTGTIMQIPLAARVANALNSYWAYLGTTLYPYPLYVPYLFIERNVPLALTVLGAIALVAITLVAIFVRPRAYFTTGWLWYVGTLVPVIGFVQVGEQSMADRYTYVPAIGLYLIIAWAMAELAERGTAWRRASLALSGAALLVLVVLSIVQVGYWRDTRTLFEHTLKFSPDSHSARMALAAQASYDGDHQLALVEARHALAIDARSNLAKVTIARSLARTGKTGEAIEAYAPAIAENPRLPILLVELARIHATCDEARYRNGPAAVRYALAAHQRFGAQNPMVLDTLAAAYAEAGNWPAAEQTATTALKMSQTLYAAGYTEVQPLIDGLEARLALYRQQKPYRVPLGVWKYLVE